MERFELENSKEFKAAQELARALNDSGGMKNDSHLQRQHFTKPSTNSIVQTIERY